MISQARILYYQIRMEALKTKREVLAAITAIAVAKKNPPSQATIATLKEIREGLDDLAFDLNAEIEGRPAQAEPTPAVDSDDDSGTEVKP